MNKFSMNRFKELLRAGFRPYLFEVDLSFMVEFYNDKDFPRDLANVLCKASNVPGLDINGIVVDYGGLQFKLAGSPTYADLTFSFFNDEKLKLRTAFENWHQKIIKITDDGPIAGYPAEYMRDITLYLLDLKFNRVKKYVLKYAFPISIASFAVDQSTKDEVGLFDVTIQYTYPEISTSNLEG